MIDRPGRRPRFWILLGCGGILLVGLLAAGAVAFVGFRSVHDLKLQMSDAGLRESRARAVLGVDELPAGYRAGVARSIPPIFEMALLFDRPVDEGRIPPGTEHAFVYLHWKWGGPDWDAFVGEGRDPAPLLAEQGFGFTRDGRLARDRFPLGPARVVRASYRGVLTTGDGQQVGGLVSVLLVDCPADHRARIALWVGPDPDPQHAVSEADFGGSVADRNEIVAFLSGFRFCD